MRKSVLIVVCIFLTLLICGCTPKEQNDMESTGNKKVTFINGVKDADVWILAQTEKNLKTTVWGTATASKVGIGESREVPLCKPGDEGLYILRMIDADSFYYSANGITLEDGWSIEITENEYHAVTVEVTDGNGGSKAAYEAFSARL